MNDAKRDPTIKDHTVPYYLNAQRTAQDQPSEFKLGKHRSNALELLQKQAVIEVEGDIAICDGGGGSLGHPLEYIKLGDRQDYDELGGWDAGVPCIYCGLRFRKKGGLHH